MSNTINTTVHTGTFTKADGTKRTMRFVRWGDIPSSYKSNSHPPRGQINEGVETVYDVEQKGYRSFNNSTAEEGSMSSVRENVNFG